MDADDKRKKQAVIASIILAVIVVIAFLGMKHSGGSGTPGEYGELPAGVEMGDSLETVIDKSSAIDAESADSYDVIYTLSEGSVYGHHFERLTYWIDPDGGVWFVDIVFNDPDLDQDKLIEEVSATYGVPEPDNGSYGWVTDDMTVVVGMNEESKCILAFYGKPQ